MRKIKKIVICIFMILLTFNSYVYAKDLEVKKDVEPNKIWKIKFTKEVMLDNENIVVKDLKGNKVPVVISKSVEDGKTVEIKPIESYRSGNTYYLSISEGLKSKENKKFNKKLTMPFTIKEEVLSKDLKVHYIDVGQGDSILVQINNKNLLIDAGTNNSTSKLIDYLLSQNIKRLDYIIATHPHEDHIGGMATVIKEFEVGEFIAPKVTSNTKTFENMITALKNKSLKIVTANVGDKYNLDAAQFEILAPNNENYEDMNNYSVVIKLKYGNKSFIFTGDAEALSEGEILKKQLDLSADVLKIGHHGSNSSTSEEFLDKVNPKHAIISVGKGNDYGHPTEKTLSKLAAKEINIYRTDILGTIIASCDGNNIRFNANPIVAPVIDSNVYITKSGKKYHKNNCSGLSKSKIPITLEDAKAKGYTPCSLCNP